MKELEIYFRKINKDLFGFSYNILPDDLQAQQVIVDATYVFALKRKDLSRELIEFKTSEEKSTIFLKIKFFLYCQIFSIGKKRLLQLGNSIDYDQKFASFYQLDLLERVVLFLKHRTNFSNKEIGFIIDHDELDVVTLLSSARKNLMNYLGEGPSNILSKGSLIDI